MHTCPCIERSKEVKSCINILEQHLETALQLCRPQRELRSVSPSTDEKETSYSRVETGILLQHDGNKTIQGRYRYDNSSLWKRGANKIYLIKRVVNCWIPRKWNTIIKCCLLTVEVQMCSVIAKPCETSKCCVVICHFFIYIWYQRLCVYLLHQYRSFSFNKSIFHIRVYF